MALMFSTFLKLVILPYTHSRQYTLLLCYVSTKDTYQVDGFSRIVKEHTGLFDDGGSAEDRILQLQTLDTRLGEFNRLQQAEEFTCVAQMALEFGPSFDHIRRGAGAGQVKHIEPGKVLHQTAQLFTASGGGQEPVDHIDMSMRDHNVYKNVSNEEEERKKENDW